MNELSGKDYEMLYLYLFKQISTKEIGETMGISENNIRTYIKRARKRFLHKRGMIMTVEEKLAQTFGRAHIACFETEMVSFSQELICESNIGNISTDKAKIEPLSLCE
jgi:hypothetical protein